MFCTKYIKTVLLIIYCGLPLTSDANNTAHQCGAYTFHAEIVKISDFGDTKLRLYIQKNNKERQIIYQSEVGGYYSVACVRNSKNRELLLFTDYHGGNGSGAGPEDAYGIFDPKENKMLLFPTGWPKGNSKQAKKILGYEPPFLDEEDDEYFFCCSARQYDED